MTAFLAECSWEQVVPFIGMASVPLVGAIGILWKQLLSVQTQLVEQAQTVFPLASGLSQSLPETASLIVGIQDRSPSKDQIDRFNRNIERLERMASARKEGR
jgi:hypothetical protein